MPSAIALLLIADGRFPAGGYAHVVGLEEAVREGLVRDVKDIGAYLDGVIATAGVLAADAAALGCALAHNNAPAEHWRRLDREVDARVAAPAARRASRLLGRHLQRAAAVFGSAALEAVTGAAAGCPEGPHQATALGALVAATGGGSADAARLAVYGTAMSVVQGATRLLGVDPLVATSLVVARGEWMEEVGREAAVRSTTTLEQWPEGFGSLWEPTGVVLEYLLESQESRQDRLFAS